MRNRLCARGAPRGLTEIGFDAMDYKKASVRYSMTR